MTEMKHNKLIVVLGMHRSGTSAVTRGLQVMGVSLGERMMPAVEGNNPKGFWEDIDLNALNVEMLRVIDSDWYHVAAIEPIDVEVLCTQGYLLRAIELLRQKVGSLPVFGFKDPRVAKLLPFWQEVFKHCQCDVSYVIAVRHPLSVVKSLAKRDVVEAEQGYLLWLSHVIASLIGSAGDKRVLVDYDRLMHAPDRELLRVANCIGLEIDSTALQIYKNEFLDQGLRHTVYDLNDLLVDNACPPLVREVYAALLDVASDKTKFDDLELQSKVGCWADEFERLKSPLVLVDKFLVQRIVATQTVAERDGQITNLKQVAVDYEGQINAYRIQAKQFDEQLSAASVQLASLNQAMAERDNQIANLNQSVAEWKQEVAALYNSYSWRITKPLRSVSHLLRGNLDESRCVRAEGMKQPAPLSSNLITKQIKAVKKSAQRELDGLPDNFDPNTYLKLNPDLADMAGMTEAGQGLALHYLRHGRHEGRTCALPVIDVLEDHKHKSDCETILLVSHEASRTGAPILSLNLAQAFVGRYNVVVLLLSGGPLTNAFRLAGAMVATPSSPVKGNPVLADSVVDQLCKQFNFKFALVNSIESSVALSSLGDNYVPTISLIHEFASYTRPRNGFREALFWSGEIVFSAKVTRENAVAEYPELGDRSAHILPQGRCLVPLEGFSEEQCQAESARIRRLIRPKDIADDAVIVLGAGFVQLRKGVDLFIQCAARVLRAPGGERCRFVWIGKGYDPENDIAYSVYLADQILRAGLHKHVFFIAETPAIETAYEEADLFLLSSRLDPLPNVAIDAMAYGVPVLCFNKTTGIADFLIDSGLRNHCVAEYLDLADLAEKILVLAGSQALRQQVGDQCREASMAYFNMKEYVARLEVLARSVCACTQQEKADVQVIVDSGLFRSDFSCPLYAQGQSIEATARGYVRAWTSGMGWRKPFPGFHPGIYLEQHGLVIPEADPFADYLRAGRPEGPWNYPVIVAGKTKAQDLPDNQRVALHLHVYYPELLPEIITRLSCNRICPDLFVSVTNEKNRELVAGELKDYKGTVVDMQIVPNRGRDIGPLLTAFGQKILANYDYVGHIHTKKSVDVKDAAVGKRWRRFLLKNLLGGESLAMADTILATMKDDTSIGMVFPDDPNIVGWGANRALAESLGVPISLPKLPEHFNFPVGTMFWARTAALAPLINSQLSWDDYPEEPLPYDGTVLHAIERLFALSLAAEHLHIATTNVVGLTR